ncbi:hypothetical protein XELAEV_18031039mg [Xenopus laevis]|uniref:GIY-YIG domain-containing protein n=1 Tax=Xenopus laevis TaxID=8355 RepID=A0A974CN23_XENLA|nr:hypothetical protein XELAEV_18031039mg [Xenopus laevis]
MNHRKDKKKTEGPRITFVTQYGPLSRQINMILRKTIGSKVSRSLVQKEDIQSNTFLGTKNTGMYQCLNCTQCKHVIRGKTFVHPDTGESVQIRGYHTCLSQFVVYLIVCPCGKIYVGETVKKVKSHISQHKSTIKPGNLALPCFRPFKEHGHTVDQLRFMVLETIPPLKRGGDGEQRLKQREVWWINKLNSLHPHGLNKVYDLYLL